MHHHGTGLLDERTPFLTQERSCVSAGGIVVQFGFATSRTSSVTRSWFTPAATKGILASLRFVVLLSIGNDFVASQP